MLKKLFFHFNCGMVPGKASCLLPGADIKLEQKPEVTEEEIFQQQSCRKQDCNTKAFKRLARKVKKSISETAHNTADRQSVRLRPDNGNLL